MGEAKLYFEDVNEGDEAPVLTHTLERTDLVRYAGASGDYNPMHHDEVKAQAAGQPSVFGHGMFSMGLLGTAITNYVGVGNLTHYQVRFARQTWPGEQLSTRVAVVQKRDENGRYFVELECSLKNQDGEEKVTGVATAELESVSSPKPVKPVKKTPTGKAPSKSSAKKAPAKKAPVKKSSPAKSSAKKAPAKKAPAKKAAVKKAAVKKAAAKKAPVKKATAKKAAPAKKAATNKAQAKKDPPKKTAARKR
jgi:acyl dehydratase